MMELCRKRVSSRTAYARHYDHQCQLPCGHIGKCEEFPFLSHLRLTHPRVADKIQRDATMTTGAAWKSEKAGPNRMPRYVAVLSDEILKEKFGILMSELPAITVMKIREKGANYDSCLDAARKLTWLAYGLADAPEADTFTKQYLESFFGEIRSGSTVCEICRLPINIVLFEENRVGKAAVETAHKTPRLHNAENVGFAHRFCNVAQGDKSLIDFYNWMRSVLDRIQS